MSGDNFEFLKKMVYDKCAFEKSAFVKKYNCDFDLNDLYRLKEMIELFNIDINDINVLDNLYMIYCMMIKRKLRGSGVIFKTMLILGNEFDCSNEIFKWKGKTQVEK